MDMGREWKEGKGKGREGKGKRWRKGHLVLWILDTPRPAV